MAIIKKASIRRSVIRFDDVEAMTITRAAIEHAVREGAALQMVMPLGGGKVANPLKTGQAHLPDISEHVAAVMLAAIVDAVTQVHAPGAHITMIPDAGLHSDDMGFSATEHVLHLRQLRRDFVWLGVQEEVSMADTLAYLPDNWVDEVRRRADDARARLGQEAGFRAQVDAQVASLRFSMGLRALGWTDAKTVQVMTALVNPEDPRLTPDVRAAAEALLTRTQEAAARYVGTNHALRSLDLPRRVLLNTTGDGAYLRLTVHAKPGEARPALVPSSRIARPGLLPMHGIGVLDRADKVRMGTYFHLEARMRGYRAVKDEAGRVLFHEPVRN